MRRIDAFLTEIVQRVDDEAIVYAEELEQAKMRFWVELKDEDVELGPNFKAARAACEQYTRAIIRRENSRK